MAVLVTRPHPDDEATAASLRARGFEVLKAPMLRFEPAPSTRTARRLRRGRSSPAPMRCAASSRSSRAVRLLKLPLFAVGEHTAAAARGAGFEKVISAGGDAASLRDLCARQREGEGAEENQPAALSRRRRSGARSRRASLANAALPSSRRPPTGWRRCPACRARPATPLPPTGSRRCCIIRGAARGPSWRRCAPPASKSRRFRSRNAAFREGVAAGAPRRRGEPGHGGGLAGRKCPVRGVGPCVAAGIALKGVSKPWTRSA